MSNINSGSSVIRTVSRVLKSDILINEIKIHAKILRKVEICKHIRINEFSLYNIAIHYTYIKKGRNTIENNVSLTHESVYIYSENCVLEAWTWPYAPCRDFFNQDCESDRDIVTWNGHHGHEKQWKIQVHASRTQL